jgi:hypothetical protein
LCITKGKRRYSPRSSQIQPQLNDILFIQGNLLQGIVSTEWNIKRWLLLHHAIIIHVYNCDGNRIVNVQQFNLVNLFRDRRKVKTNGSTILVIVGLILISIVLLDDQDIAKVVTILIWIVTVWPGSTTIAHTRASSYTVLIW